MYIVSAREFRSNQGKYLTAAKNGQSVLLTSRFGNFKLSPITEQDSLSTRICEGLHEVKKTEAGELKVKSARAFLDEL